MSNWKLITPEATTNIITNPSFEDGTTGWITTGLNTIAQSQDQYRRGLSSLKGIYISTGNLTIAQYAITFPTAGSYAVSADVFISSTYSGSSFNMQLSGFTGITGTTSVSADITLIDQWQRISLVATLAADLIGNIQLFGGSTITVNDFVYIDGVQAEAGTYATTYTDTTRDALDATGGKVNDLSDDLSFTIAGQDGTGMPPVSNLSSPLALQPGSIFEDQTIDARQFTLTGSIVGSTLEDFHAKRQGLIAALNPKTVKINERAQARTFRYTGSVVDKQISAVYDGGMELGLKQNDGFGMMDIPLRLKSDDPMFYDLYDSYNNLATETTIASSEFRKRDGIKWGEVETGLGNVWAMETEGDFIYVGGSSGQGIYKVNTTTGAETSLGSGVNNTVFTIALDGQGGVYVGGDFTTAGGAGANRIAHFDGVSTWSALGTGLNSTCEDIEVDSNGNVYAIGNFTTAGGIAVGYVAVWNGATWAAMGTGLNAPSEDLAIDANNNVYAVGSFSTAGGVTADRAAIWNGATWASLSSAFDGSVMTAVYDGDNNILFVGGLFTGYIKQYKNEIWETIGTELGDNCFDLVLNGGKLYASGDVIAKLAEGLAVYDGYAWGNLGIGSAGSSAFRACAIASNGDVYAGGASATVYTAGETDVSYSGTAEAYMVIIIKRDGGTSAAISEISNFTTGARIGMYYELADGETITINTKPGEQSATSSIDGDVYSKIAPGSAFGNFYLMPGNTLPFTNEMGCLIIEAGSPTITARIEYRTTYMSED